MTVFNSISVIDVRVSDVNPYVSYILYDKIVRLHYESNVIDAPVIFRGENESRPKTVGVKYIFFLFLPENQ